MEDGMRMQGSMTNSPLMACCSSESARKLVGLVLKVGGGEEGTLPLASDSVLGEYDGGGCGRFSRCTMQSYGNILPLRDPPCSLRAAWGRYRARRSW